MGAPIRNPEPMRVEEFFAFTDARPDNEKWELIEGEAVMHASPSGPHQTIVANILGWLYTVRRERQPSWTAIPGIGVRVSATNLPEPDILIRPNTRLIGRECDDVIVAMEILSESTANLDLCWKRKAYARLPSLTHYVVVAQDAVEVTVYAREAGFAERRIESPDATLDLPALGIAPPLAEIYRDTDLS